MTQIANSDCASQLGLATLGFRDHMPGAPAMLEAETLESHDDMVYAPSGTAFDRHLRAQSFLGSADAVPEVSTDAGKGV